MDWKKKHYFRDSTAYSHTWAATDIYCTAASDNMSTRYGCTTADNDHWTDAVTTYITKADIIYENLVMFHAHATGVAYATAVYNTFSTYEESAEEKAIREERERVLAVEVKKADHKARLLFLKIAGKHRYRLLKRNGYFDIVGKSGQRYRLAVGEKVRVMRGCFGDEALHKLCAYVPDVPAVDTLLAQYLALTSGTEGEAEFAKIAIKHAA